MQSINEVSSVLQLKDLQVRKCSFELKSNEITEMDINLEFQVQTKVNISNDDEHIILLNVMISNDSNEFELHVKYKGVFSLPGSKSINAELRRTLLTRNTLAIMFPYIRSQISLLTTAPGIAPMMIPILNINNVEIKNVDICE